MRCISAERPAQTRCHADRRKAPPGSRRGLRVRHLPRRALPPPWSANGPIRQSVDRGVARLCNRGRELIARRGAGDAFAATAVDSSAADLFWGADLADRRTCRRNGRWHYAGVVVARGGVPAAGLGLSAVVRDLQRGRNCRWRLACRLLSATAWRCCAP